MNVSKCICNIFSTEWYKMRRYNAGKHGDDRRWTSQSTYSESRFGMLFDFFTSKSSCAAIALLKLSIFGRDGNHIRLHSPSVLSSPGYFARAQTQQLFGDLEWFVEDGGDALLPKPVMNGILYLQEIHSFTALGCNCTWNRSWLYIKTEFLNYCKDMREKVRPRFRELAPRSQRESGCGIRSCNLEPTISRLPQSL